MVAEATDHRKGPLNGDAFRLCEAEVVVAHGPQAFVLALHVYSDSSVVSWSGAPKLYPVRIKVENVIAKEEVWLTIAYLSSVPTEKGPGGAERSRQSRIAIIQRVLSFALRRLIRASHTGVGFVNAAGRKLLAFPRVLLYLCDQPGERAVLRSKPGQCAKPCSTCDVSLAFLSAPSALTAKRRSVLNTLHPQLEAAGHMLHGRERRPRLNIERAHGVNSYMPALAAMAGLTTAPILLYKMIGLDILHILDLGVTRLLVHRLVHTFPSLCEGYDPLCCSFVATYAAANRRLKFLGRRCRASRAGPGRPERSPQRCECCVFSGFCSYTVSIQEKQAMFTGSEQHLGVWILPFLVLGIFDRGRRKQAKPAAASPAPAKSAGCGAGPTPSSAVGADVIDDAVTPEAGQAFADVAGGASGTEESLAAGTPGFRADNGPPQEGADPARELLQGRWDSANNVDSATGTGHAESAGGARDDGGGDIEALSAVQGDAQFDWAACRRAFPDTPPYVAITAMFAEYALLVGRITRHLGDAVTAPMTLSEGEAIAEQARTFASCYATPILGSLHTSKVHKLLCGLCDAVRLRGSIANGGTSHKEQRHKDDRRHYARTSKSTTGYLRQLVRLAQGTRAVLRRNNAAAAAEPAGAAGNSNIDGSGYCSSDSSGDSDRYDSEDERKIGDDGGGKDAATVAGADDGGDAN